MTTSVKIGLMGYGFAGATFHAPVIAHCGTPADRPNEPYVCLGAIATSQPAKALADYPAARAVPDLDALLALEDIECVVIATPNDTHFDMAAKVLRAGKHVVVDKPVTLTAADAATLARLARDQNLVFAPFHNRRWDGDFLTVRQLLAKGTLGDFTRAMSALGSCITNRISTGFARRCANAGASRYRAAAVCSSISVRI